MKTLLTTFFALAFSIQSFAQGFEFGAGFGSGSVYFVEEVSTSALNTDFAAPLSFFGDITFRYPDSYFDFKARVQYFQANIQQSEFPLTQQLSDYVSNFSAYVLLEHINTEKKWALGYAIGPGYCKEQTFATYFGSSNGVSQQSEFINIYASAIGALKTSDRMTLTLEPTVIWNDVAGTFLNDWGTAGEDIHLLLQLGFRYRFK